MQNHASRNFVVKFLLSRYFSTFFFLLTMKNYLLFYVRNFDIIILIRLNKEFLHKKHVIC